MLEDESYLADLELAPGDGWYFGEHTKLVVNNAEVVKDDLANTGHIRISVKPSPAQMEKMMTVKGKKVKIISKTKKLKKTKKISAKKAYIIKNKTGRLTFKKVKVNKSSGKFKVNAKTGQITVKKGLKRGTYKLTVKISGPGNTNSQSAGQKAVVTIVVKK